MTKKILFTLVCLISTTLFASNASTTVWNVTGKTCNGVAQTVQGSERLHLSEGMFAHIYLLSENETSYCYRVQAFGRLIQSYENETNGYKESSILLSPQQRTACTGKTHGNTISDVTEPLSVPMQNLELVIFGTTGYAEVTGSLHCEGVLRFDLKQ